MFDEETCTVIFFQDPRGIVCQRPVSGASGTDLFDHAFQIQSCRFRINKQFGHAGHRARHHYLVGHFCVLTTAGRPLQHHFARKNRQNSFNGIKRSFLTTDHRCERSILSTLISSRNWSIQRADPAFFAESSYFPGQSRRTGRHINENMVVVRFRKDTALPKISLFNIFRITHHRDDNIRLRRNSSRGVTPHCSFRDNSICPAFRPIIDLDWITRIQKMFDHG